MNTGFGPISGGHRRDHAHVGDRPQAMDHAQVIGCLQRRLAGDGGFQHVPRSRPCGSG